MRFDPFKWSSIHDEKPRKGPAGLLHVMSTSPQAQVWVEAEGIEALAGVGTDVQVKVSPPYRFAVKVPKGHYAQVYEPVLGATVPTGPVFTNLDRVEVSSTHVDEVKSALRQFKIEQADIMRRVRQEKADLERRRRASQEQPKEAEQVDDDRQEIEVQEDQDKEE